MVLTKKVLAALVASILVGGSAATISLAYAGQIKTRSISYADTNYSSSLVFDFNASLADNSLFSSHNVTNPSVLFSNITQNLTMASFYSFYSSRPVNGSAEITTYEILQSGTSPQWNKTIYSNSETLLLNSTTAHVWETLPINLDQNLEFAWNTDRLLNITFENPTFLFHSVMYETLNGEVIANSTNLSLTIYYPASFGSVSNPLNWQYATAGHYGSASNSGQMTSDNVVQLPNDKTLLTYIGYASTVFTISCIAMLLISAQDTDHDEFDSFLKAHRDVVISVMDNPLNYEPLFRLPSLKELHKLVETSNSPLLFFSDSNCEIIFTRHDSGVYYYRRDHADATVKYRRTK